jgi:hypothetical protein
MQQSNAARTEQLKQQLLVAQHKFTANPRAGTHAACLVAMEEWMLWSLSYPEGSRLLYETTLEYTPTPRIPA